MRTIDDAEYARDFDYTHGPDADHEADRAYSIVIDCAQDNAEWLAQGGAR